MTQSNQTDECWNCQTDIHLVNDRYYEVRMFDPGVDKRCRNTLHRLCQTCGQILPGVNQDNVDAILHPER